MEITNPFAALAPETEQAASKPKATRKPRQGKKAVNNDSIKTLAQSLQGVHLGIAAFSHIPEIAIEADQANALAAAIDGAMSEFEVEISPAAQALGNLIITAGMIYIPMVMAIKARIAHEAKETEESEKAGTKND